MIDTPRPSVRRLSGAAFLVAVAVFIGTSVAIYARAFEPVLHVELTTDSVGNSLTRDADVKMRGVLVGRVESSRPTSSGTVVSTLALNPDTARMIPGNVTARILPKTLFGERYVALQMPDRRDGTALRDGATVLQDRSGNAVEVSEILDSILPLLDAVPPRDLGATLGALSGALSGRGEQIGLTIDRLEKIFTGLDTQLPAIKADLQGVAKLSVTYSTAAPDLVDALDNLSSVGNTVVERRNDITALLASATTTSTSVADVVEQNADSIIGLAAGSRATLDILAEYSPAVGCTLTSLARTREDAVAILSVDDPYPGIRGTLKFDNPMGAYLPNQDEPRWFDDRGPSCYDTVTAPGEFFPAYPGSSRNDGSYQPPSRNPGPAELVPARLAQNSLTPGYAGSTLERDTLAVVYGQGSGIDPAHVPAWTTLVGAPALRGRDVDIG
ncbi:MCE family protein [Rhodococcus sp. MEB064]|uniref:MCE family protein n=1 Tax=Rhodococcus sp. MEB064 TaxID=1587522 RepID=UPI0005AC3AE1|nr:MCE family protein [Rhodococcus sp. MEB064]KIQ07972.1 mammalian cell entry protein [Rhodococcus sp. MEB064]